MSRLPASPSEPGWFQRFKQGTERELSRLGQVNVKEVTATYSAARTDYSILADATAGAITIALPPVASSRGTLLNVKKIDASGNAVTLNPNGAETIDGGATLAIAVQYQSYTVICDGAEWFIL